MTFKKDCFWFDFNSQFKKMKKNEKKMKYLEMKVKNDLKKVRSASLIMWWERLFKYWKWGGWVVMVCFENYSRDVGDSHHKNTCCPGELFTWDGWTLVCHLIYYSPRYCHPLLSLKLSILLYFINPSPSFHFLL